MFTARSNKHGIYYAVYLWPSKCGQVFLDETPLQPFYFACFNALDETIVKCGVLGRKQYWFRTDLY
jgi:hypothetical protein